MIAWALLLAACLPDDPLPADLAGWMRRQDAQMNRGEGDRALEEARARAAKEKSPESLFVLGRLLGNLGRVDEARTNFQAALDADPAYAPAWRGMSLVHMKGKEFATAVREARRAFELEESPENLGSLAQALYQNGERAAAYRLFTDALAKTPGDNDLRTSYAYLKLTEGLFRDAEREVRQVLATDPDNLAARSMLVSVLTSTGRQEDAIAECRDILVRRPKDGQTLLTLYNLLVGRKEYGPAATVLEEVLRLDLHPKARAEMEGRIKDLRAAADWKPGPEDGAPAADLDFAQVLKDLDSKEVEVRRAAMRVLWGARLPFLPGALLRRAADEDEDIRSSAIRLVGRDGDATHLWIPNLLLFNTKSRDASLQVRMRAVQAVGSIGSEAGLVILFRAFEEPEPEILGAAVRAVRDITGKCLAEDPDLDPPADGIEELRGRAAKWWYEDAIARQWRKKAARAVASGMDGPTRDLAWYLVPWVQEEDPDVRAAMLDAFARISGDPSWRTLPTATAAEREAARNRAYAFLAERDRSEKEKAQDGGKKR